MYIQKCVKGIAGDTSGKNGLTQSEAQEVISQDHGIMSNWWRRERSITPQMVADVLTSHNLDRHLHDYQNFGDETPFISLASGAVEKKYHPSTEFCLLCHRYCLAVCHRRLDEAGGIVLLLGGYEPLPCG